MQTTMVDGVEYQYETDTDDNGLLTLDVYSNDEHIVGVFFDHDLESAVVEGPEFSETAPYFELQIYTIENLVGWAVAQIPG